MTSKEFPAFFGALGKLAVMYRVKMDKPTARAYFEALGTVPLAVLMPAMQHLLAHGGDFMPTASRILETVDELADSREADEGIAALSGRLALDGEVATVGPGGYACATCEDTGRRQICPGCNDPRTCANVTSGAYCPHFKEGRYSLPVAACACVASNPEILRKTKAERRRGPRYSKHTTKERNFYGRDGD